jgi:hypothetical protein
MKFARRFTPIAYNLQRSHILAALFALVILGGLLVAATGWVRLNDGFGPDWDCTKPGSGDPVCIKKLTPVMHAPLFHPHRAHRVVPA